MNKNTSKTQPKWGRAYSKGGAYWKEGTKSNHYGNHGFGGHLDG